MTPVHQADVKAALSGAVNDGTYDEKAWREFLDQMDDDMNTPNAYTVIFETVKKLNQALRQREPDWKNALALRNSIVKMLDLLGITVDEVNVTDEDRALFAKWNEAKAAKDFAAADQYRAKLTEKGLL